MSRNSTRDRKEERGRKGYREKQKERVSRNAAHYGLSLQSCFECTAVMLNDYLRTYFRTDRRTSWFIETAAPFKEISIITFKLWIQ